MNAPLLFATQCLYIHLARYREVRYPCFIDEKIMLAKKTSKNQVTLPKKALQEREGPRNLDSVISGSLASPTPSNGGE